MTEIKYFGSQTRGPKERWDLGENKGGNILSFLLVCSAYLSSAQRVKASTGWLIPAEKTFVWTGRRATVWWFLMSWPPQLCSPSEISEVLRKKTGVIENLWFIYKENSSQKPLCPTQPSPRRSEDSGSKRVWSWIYAPRNQKQLRNDVFHDKL